MKVDGLRWKWTFLGESGRSDGEKVSCDLPMITWTRIIVCLNILIHFLAKNIKYVVPKHSAFLGMCSWRTKATAETVKRFRNQRPNESHSIAKNIKNDLKHRGNNISVLKLKFQNGKWQSSGSYKVGWISPRYIALSDAHDATENIMLRFIKHKWVNVLWT